MPRRRMRFLRDEHRWKKSPRLPDPDGRFERWHEPNYSAAAHTGLEGSGSRSHGFVRAIRADRALAAKRPGAARPRTPSVARRARPARRVMGVHPLLLLLDLLPELLVEPGQVSRPVNPAAVLSLARR